eukprot:SAG22_NODE_1349_length_4655_cov_6.900132_7_plen_240_part_00
MPSAEVAASAVALALLLIFAGQSRAGSPPPPPLRPFQKVGADIHQIHIREWDVLGPFPIGKTEVDADPVAAMGGLANIARGSKRVRMLSEIAPGGYATWTKVRSQNGNVQVQYPGVNWNQLLQWMDNMMLLETQGYFVGDLSIPAGAGGTYQIHADRCAEQATSSPPLAPHSPSARPCHARPRCTDLGPLFFFYLGTLWRHSVHSFTIDGTLYHGDIYSQQQVWSTLHLEPGKHTVVIR